MSKQKFRVEYLIYLFLLLTPFLDALSFIFRKYVPNAKVSPSTILRPLIPLILLFYIFIKDRESRKYMFIGAIIYIIYGIIHLFVFQNLHTGFNAGSVISEAQYILNYTYMIFLFYAIYWFYKKRGLPHLQKYLCLMLVCYLILIYLSIITGTSSSTYIDGVGYKGWNASGNGLSAIFILGFCSTFTYLLKYIKKWYVWIYLGSLFYFLLILFGTRTAFFGSILVIFLYGISRGFIYLIKSKKINLKQLVFFILILVVLGGSGVVGGANVLKRRQNMASLGSVMKDPLTGKETHLTGDLTQFVVEIKEDNLSIEMSDYQKLALLKTYKDVNKYNVKNTNRRMQQLIYHHHLFQEELTLKTFLFGTGYLNNYPELTLEMEVPAFFYNFGLLGFILYFGPFLILLVYFIHHLFINLKKVTVDYLLYLAAAGLSVVLSLMTGYVYFYVSSMLVVICMFILLLREKESL